MATKYERRHYEDVAKILKEYAPVGWGYISDNTQIKYDTAQDIAEDFARLFKADNPNFNEAKFQKACGFKWVS